MKNGVIEKIGSVGAVLAALSCPVCFPMLAVAGTALGLEIFRPFEGWIFILFQILLVIAMLGNLISFARHRRVFPLIIGLASPLLIFVAFYVRFNQLLLYLGLFGVAAASVLNFFANRQCVRC